jgi:CheY-like chemotaxis protein
MATILIVDDRPSNRSYLSALLGLSGHRILEAETAPARWRLRAPSCLTSSSPTS